MQEELREGKSGERVAACSNCPKGVRRAGLSASNGQGWHSQGN